MYKLIEDIDPEGYSQKLMAQLKSMPLFVHNLNF